MPRSRGPTRRPLQLLRIDVSTRDKRGKTMRATGFSNAAVAARATLEDLKPVITLQANLAESMRSLILKELAQYAAWDAGRCETRPQQVRIPLSMRRRDDVVAEKEGRTDRHQGDVLIRGTFVWIAGDEPTTNMDADQNKDHDR
jgi:hypothetical protein